MAFGPQLLIPGNGAFMFWQWIMNEESHASSDIPSGSSRFLCVYTYRIQMSRPAEEEKTWEEAIHHEVDGVDYCLTDHIIKHSLMGVSSDCHHLSRPDVFNFEECTRGPKKHLTFPPKHKVIVTTWYILTFSQWKYILRGHKWDLIWFVHDFCTLDEEKWQQIEWPRILFFPDMSWPGFLNCIWGINVHVFIYFPMQG